MYRRHLFSYGGLRASSQQMNKLPTNVVMQEYKTAGNAAYEAFMKQVSHHITTKSKDSF